MEQQRKNKVKDLFEMLEEPDSTRYIGEEIDEMDLYDNELEEEESNYEDEDPDLTEESE